MARTPDRPRTLGLSPYRVIDVSRETSPASLRFPGTPAVDLQAWQRPGGWGLQTLITQLTHSGTHLDAQTHLNKPGTTISEYPLVTFVGTAVVFDVSHRREGGVLPKDFEGNVLPGDRVLFRTRNSLKPGNDYDENYAGVTRAAMRELREAGAVLVGIDAQSIPQPGEDGRLAHAELLDHGVPILEGLDLSDAPAGEYLLVAAPIKYPGLDGAPTRAVLLDFGNAA